MLLWFVATSVLTIHYVFTNHGSTIDRSWSVRCSRPDGPRRSVAPASHTAWWVPSGLLAVVMLATAGRRPIRKRLIAVPIGILLHLVFDGAWAADHVFWWPFLGGFGDTALPIVSRGWWNVVLELAGAALIVWAWRSFGLADPSAGVTPGGRVSSQAVR